MSHISKKREKIYEYICSRIKEDGYPPSTREICEAVNLKSPSTVHGHIQALVDQGLLEKVPGKKRTLRAVGQNGSGFISVPLVGKVTAGLPILAVEQIEGYIPFPAEKSHDKVLFALKIKGDSMINAGILDGDIVIVEKTNHAYNGQIVVALIGDEATVKRLKMDNGRVMLMPENPDYSPIVSDNISVLGKVIADIRYYRDYIN